MTNFLIIFNLKDCSKKLYFSHLIKSDTYSKLSLVVILLGKSPIGSYRILVYNLTKVFKYQVYLDAFDDNESMPDQQEQPVGQPEPIFLQGIFHPFSSEITLCFLLNIGIRSESEREWKYECLISRDSHCKKTILK